MTKTSRKFRGSWRRITPTMMIKNLLRRRGRKERFPLGMISIFFPFFSWGNSAILSTCGCFSNSLPARFLAFIRKYISITDQRTHLIMNATENFPIYQAVAWREQKVTDICCTVSLRTLLFVENEPFYQDSNQVEKTG